VIWRIHDHRNESVVMPAQVLGMDRSHAACSYQGHRQLAIGKRFGFSGAALH